MVKIPLLAADQNEEEEEEVDPVDEQAAQDAEQFNNLVDKDDETPSASKFFYGMFAHILPKIEQVRRKNLDAPVSYIDVHGNEVKMKTVGGASYHTLCSKSQSGDMRYSNITTITDKGISPVPSQEHILPLRNQAKAGQKTSKAADKKHKTQSQYHVQISPKRRQ